VLAGHGGLQFRHDRVQQAVLATLDDDRRATLQVNMARRMPDMPMLAAQQYLGGVRALQELHEQCSVARLFQDVAAQYSNVASYALAQSYLTAAGALLDSAGEPVGSALRVAIDSRMHAALYGQGRLDEADPYYARIHERTGDVMELIEPACLQIRSLTNRGRMGDAERLGMELLPRLGLSVPSGALGSDTARRLDALCRWVHQERECDPRERSELADPRALATAKLLTRVLFPALISNRDVMAWLVLESQRLWIEHGPCAELTTCMARAGMVLVNLRQDYRAAYEVVRHVLHVAQTRGYRPHASETRHSFAITICHWFEPLEDVLNHTWRARDELLVYGDQSFACYTYRTSVLVVLDCAPCLDSFDSEIQGSLALSRRTGNVYNTLCALTDQQLLRCLRGQTDTPGSFAQPDFNPAAHQEKLTKLPIALVTWHMRLALAAAIFGDMRSLLTHINTALPMLGVIPSYYLTAHGHLLRALALAEQLRHCGDLGTAAALGALADLEQSRAWLSDRAQDQPQNFGHISDFVQAHQAWALGDRWGASAAFDAALQRAGNCQRPWHLALIMERAALFFIEHGMTHTGRSLLAEARDRYQAWGAVAKVNAMQREHSWLQADVPRAPGPTRLAPTGHSGAISPDTLDLMGVVRASQALSSETSLDRLTARVQEVLGALTGATRVSVLSWSDGQWWLLARATGEQPVLASEAAADGHLPSSAFGYADRTQEPLLVDDALNDDRFSRDPYFAGLAHCSLLLVPIAIQGAPRAMLLLENRLGRAAFNAERLDAVMLIAGQLAVSLANVQLLESLEQRVRERTRELQDTQAQLVSTARRAGMAEIANNVLHNVGNVLNSVNISAGVVSNRISGSKTQGLARAVGLMNDNAGRLGEFMSNDERGKLLPGYLNQLVDALDEERSAVIDELARLVRSVNHIKAVVATQQSHAGASNVLEMEHASQLVDEALRMNAASMERHRVTPVRQFETVPQLPLDRLKVLQIMVNLIHNAAQAMDALPEHARRMTLSIEVVRDGSGEHLRIKVRDEGEGISKENLARIFSHGFTTRKDGHGFGLHSSALAAIEMGGTLTAHSDGPGQGAIFMLELPITARSKGNEREPANPDR
jgi:signal transduction histidine kinase